MARENSAARFVIVGDGILLPELERHAQERGVADRVIFTGWRRDLPGIYADLDVLAVTSNNEGTPVSAIEAMAAGCPVVATNVGGLPDLIHEGETGYLVSPGDAPAVATALLHVLDQPEMARGMGETARKSVRERFSSQRLIPIWSGSTWSFWGVNGSCADPDRGVQDTAAEGAIGKALRS